MSGKVGSDEVDERRGAVQRDDVSEQSGRTAPRRLSGTGSSWRCNASPTVAAVLR